MAIADTPTQEVGQTVVGVSCVFPFVKRSPRLVGPQSIWDFLLTFRAWVTRLNRIAATVMTPVMAKNVMASFRFGAGSHVLFLVSVDVVEGVGPEREVVPVPWAVRGVDRPHPVAVDAVGPHSDLVT